MSQVESNIMDVLKQQFSLLEKKMNGSASSSDFKSRETAFNNILESGLPGRKNEEYRYTPLSRLLEKEMADFDKNPTTSVNPDMIPSLGDITIVFVNGEFNSNLSNLKNKDGLSIEIASLQQFPETNKKSDDTFSKLNKALASEGVNINIKKNQVVEENISIVHIIDSSKSKVMATSRHEVNLEEGTQGYITEFFIGDGEYSSFTNTALHINMAENSILTHYKVGFDSESDLRIDNTTCSQHDHSVLHTFNVNFGGKAIRNNLNISLEGEYCETNMDGLYLPAANGLIDNHTTIDHKYPNSNSNELYKGIMGDESTGVFNGKVYVREGAQKTNAFQSNKNILLSDTATINTKPQLEIWADDVQCTHGCTTGQIDKEQLFYLRARGLDEQMARKLLLKAFAEEIVLKIKDEKLKELIEAELDNQLGE
ncbi:MAG: Fe-S cluster assembly protein SufD [Bacteroidota bacterium]